MGKYRKRKYLFLPELKYNFNIALGNWVIGTKTHTDSTSVQGTLTVKKEKKKLIFIFT